MMDSETQRGRGKSPGKLIGCKIEGGGGVVLLGFLFFVVHVFSCNILSSIDILVGGGVSPQEEQDCDCNF